MYILIMNYNIIYKLFKNFVSIYIKILYKNKTNQRKKNKNNKNNIIIKQ